MLGHVQEILGDNFFQLKNLMLDFYFACSLTTEQSIIQQLSDSMTVLEQRGDFDKIRQLKPDLIIGNKEENYKQGIEKLEKEFPVWMSDIISLDDATKMISLIGEITNTSSIATNLNSKIKIEVTKLKNKNKKPKTTLYFIEFQKNSTSYTKSRISQQ